MLRRKFFSTKKKKIQPRKFFSGSYNSKIENNHVNVFYRKKTESSRRKKHGELFLFIPKKKKNIYSTRKIVSISCHFKFLGDRLWFFSEKKNDRPNGNGNKNRFSPNWTSTFINDNHV